MYNNYLYDNEDSSAAACISAITMKHFLLLTQQKNTMYSCYIMVMKRINYSSDVVYMMSLHNLH